MSHLEEKFHALLAKVFWFGTALGFILGMTFVLIALLVGRLF
jgi:hypothetical protein